MGIICMYLYKCYYCLSSFYIFVSATYTHNNGCLEESFLMISPLIVFPELSVVVNLFE